MNWLPCFFHCRRSPRHPRKGGRQRIEQVVLLARAEVLNQAKPFKVVKVERCSGESREPE